MFFYSLEALALILNQSYPQVDVFALSDGLGIYTLLQNPPALVSCSAMSKASNKGQSH